MERALMPALSIARPVMPRSSRIVALDGIRAVAICFVLISHGFQTEVAEAVGSLGVSIFFVLSGFLITSLLVSERERDGQINLRNFYGRRFRRIFPAYYAFLAVIGIATAFGLIHVDPRAFIYDALYIRNYSFNVPADWWTGHSWSLCIEEQFYFIWPLVVVFFGVRFGLRFAFLCIAIAPILRVLTYTLLPSYRSFLDVMLPTRIDMIMFGCALAIIAAQYAQLLRRLSQRVLAAVTAILVCGVIAGMRFSDLSHHEYVFIIGFTVTGLASAALILYVVSYPATFVAQVLSLRPVAWLGRISYSLYLWQQVFLTPGLNRTVFGYFPLNLAASIALAALSYYFIERRFFVPAPLRPTVDETVLA